MADKTEENINIPTEKNQEPSNSSAEKNETNNTPEVKRNQLTQFEILLSKYSSNWRLLRISAWTNKFINNIRFKEKTSGPLTAKEIENARMQWIKHVQYKTSKTIKQREKQKENNLVATLGLKLDKNGLVRCHGLFNNADIPEEAKSPIFLPKKHYWTELIVKEFHEKLFHASSNSKQILDPTRKNNGTKCFTLLWNLQEISWWSIQNAYDVSMASRKNE